MGWQFAGFFAQSELHVLEAALREWPGCHGRLITVPFRGIGVAVPEHALVHAETDEDHEQAQELAWAIENDLATWSHRYPTTLFVFIRADCFGSNYEYEGYVCQDGEIRERSGNRQHGQAALPRLVRHLSVALDDSLYFAPFTRGFFDRSERSER